jgi:hypothetical protein
MLYDILKAATYLFIGLTCAMFWLVCLTDPSIAWPPIERSLVIVLTGILFGISTYLLVYGSVNRRK